MSRKKTDSAIEHRVTLGDYERRELKSMLSLAKKEKQITNISNGVKTVATVGVIGAGVYVGYLGVLAYAAVKDGVEDVIGAIKQTAHEVPISFWNWTTGSKSYFNPETGEEFIVPKTVTDDNGLVIENPAWQVPGFGGLTYLGMLIGNAWNPITAAGYDPNADQSQPPTTPEETWLEWIMRTDPDYDFENNEWSETYLAAMAAQQALQQEWVDANLAAQKAAAEEAAAEAQRIKDELAAAAGQHFSESQLTEDGKVTTYFVLIPDDSRRPMTLMEWAVWTFRNQKPSKNDVTDSGIGINSTGLHDYYIRWYRQNVGTGSDES